MSQSALSIPNEAGASFRADVNTALQALASQSAGSSAPSTTYAYQPWFDTSTTPPTLRIRNAANNAWAVAGTLTTGNVFNPVGLTIDSSGNVTAIASAGSATLNIGSGRFYVDANGNVGLNNTSMPTWSNTIRAMHMGTVASFAGETAGSAIMADNTYYDGTNWKYITAAAAAMFYIDINGNHIWRRVASGSAGATITWLENGRFDVNGNFLVGTSTSANANNNGIALSVADGCIRPNHLNGTPTGYAYMQFGYNAASIGSITQNGTTGVAYNTSSDYRLKENIQPMQNALATVAKLKPVTYTWKADGTDGQGFIAHELQEVVPQSVTGAKDAIDENGNPVYQGIDTSFLAGLFAAAIQELNTKVDALAKK
jgi:hypothetical protein